MRPVTTLFTLLVLFLLGNVQAKSIRGEDGEILLSSPVIRVKRANGETFTNSHIIHPADYNKLTSDPGLSSIRAQNFMKALHVNDARLRRPGVNPNPLDERRVHSLIVGDPAQVHGSFNPVQSSNVVGRGVKNNVFESNQPFDVVNIRRNNNGDISRISHFISPVAAGLDQAGAPVHYQSSYVGGSRPQGIAPAETTLFQRGVNTGAGGGTHLHRGGIYSSTPNLGGQGSGSSSNSAALGNMPNTFGSSSRQASSSFNAGGVGTGSTNKGLGSSSTFGGSLTSTGSKGSGAGAVNPFVGTPTNNGFGGGGRSTRTFGSTPTFVGSGASSSSGYGTSSSFSRGGGFGNTPNFGGSISSAGGFGGSPTSPGSSNGGLVSTPNLGGTSMLGSYSGGMGPFGSTISTMGGSGGTSGGLVGSSSGSGRGLGTSTTTNSGAGPGSSSNTSSGRGRWRGRGRGSTKPRGSFRASKGK